MPDKGIELPPGEASVTPLMVRYRSRRSIYARGSLANNYLARTRIHAGRRLLPVMLAGKVYCV